VTVLLALRPPAPVATGHRRPHMVERPYPCAWVDRGSPPLHFHLLPRAHTLLARTAPTESTVTATVLTSPSLSKPRIRTALIPSSMSTSSEPEPMVSALGASSSLVASSSASYAPMLATSRPPPAQLTKPQASPTSTDHLWPEELHR
jgi:hypothetical protein